MKKVVCWTIKFSLINKWHLVIKGKGRIFFGKEDKNLSPTWRLIYEDNQTTKTTTPIHVACKITWINKINSTISSYTCLCFISVVKIKLGCWKSRRTLSEDFLISSTSYIEVLFDIFFIFFLQLRKLGHLPIHPYLYCWVSTTKPSGSLVVKRMIIKIVANLFCS